MKSIYEYFNPSPLIRKEGGAPGGKRSKNPGADMKNIRPQEKEGKKPRVKKYIEEVLLEE